MKNFVIINGKKLYDDDLNNDDIPFFVEKDHEKENVENTKDDESGEKGKGSNTIKNFSISSESLFWIFIEKPFGFKCEKLNIFIDILKIKKIKELILFLNLLKEDKEKYCFDEFLLTLDKMVRHYLGKKLSDLLQEDLQSEIKWIEENNKELNIEEELDIEKDSEEIETEVVFIKNNNKNF